MLVYSSHNIEFITDSYWCIISKLKNKAKFKLSNEQIVNKGKVTHLY
jgi:hypothetical protein